MSIEIYTYRRWQCFALAISSFVVQIQVAMAQEVPVAQLVIDVKILAAFVDEPCHHFESAKNAILRGDNMQAAHHLRTASAFLQLESFRATAVTRLPLNTSIRELQGMAASLESKPVGSMVVLEQAFARAHYALAGHHCVQSAHQCCRPSSFESKQAVRRAGQDLSAATTHLRYGALWAGEKPDEDTIRALDSARSSAKQMIRTGAVPQKSFVRTIQSVRGKLEDLAGRKIMLAPPLTEHDKLGPSIFR